MTKTDDFIKHYASEYYDPAKAREYYLRNRELKGRRSSADLKTETKKQGWDYVKNKIDSEKASVLDRAKENQSKQLELLREHGQAKRKQVSAALKKLLEGFSEIQDVERTRLSKERAKKADQIAVRTKAQIEALPPIPKGISKEKAAELRSQRREAIDKIRGDAKKDRNAVAEEAATKTASLREGISNIKGQKRDEASLSREKIAAEVKGSLDKARQNYEVLKETIKAGYESKYQREYEAIKRNA